MKTLNIETKTENLNILKRDLYNLINLYVEDCEKLGINYYDLFNDKDYLNKIFNAIDEIKNYSMQLKLMDIADNLTKIKVLKNKIELN